MIPPEGAGIVEILVWGFWLCIFAAGIGWLLAEIRGKKP